MPAPISLPVRRAILLRFEQKQDAATIAHALHLCPRTVRHLLRRFQEQPDSIQPGYRAGPGRPKDNQVVHDQAVALREQHPTWGAGYIRLRLTGTQQPSSEVPQPLPSERTLQRWFQQQKQPSAPPGRRPTAEAGRATQPHHTWQMDAVEQLSLGSSQGVCWLRLVDECSGAFLSTTVFPPVPVGQRPGIGRSGATASRVCPLGPAPQHPCG